MNADSTGDAPDSQPRDVLQPEALDEQRSPSRTWSTSTYGDSFADVYDDWYPRESATLTATVDTLAELAAGRPVLELGIGTGQVSRPLAAHGVDVVGVDASAHMLAKLADKPGLASLTAIHDDVAELTRVTRPLDGFGLVFATENTLFNLTTFEEQQQCFLRVADLLGPDGRFALECFVPPADSEEMPLGGVETRTVAFDRLVLTATRRDPERQMIIGQHVELSEREGVRLRPWRIRYASLDELDSLARMAGFTLDNRWSSWDRTPFQQADGVAVSVYGRR